MKAAPSKAPAEVCRAMRMVDMEDRAVECGRRGKLWRDFSGSNRRTKKGSPEEIHRTYPTDSQELPVSGVHDGLEKSKRRMEYFVLPVARELGIGCWGFGHPCDHGR